ncbi:TIGR03826 family flagellar region protein [Sporosarcina sp. CAU 1771]
MADLRDCPTCGSFFNYTGIRDVCGKCAMAEERKYEEVTRFLRRRENRTATIERIVEETQVSETLLHNWVRKGRLLPAMFPNLGYPCESCGELTSKGKLCQDCTETMKIELERHEATEEFREAIAANEKNAYLINRD